MTDQPDITIAHLRDCPDAVPTLAAWATAEWGHLNPERTSADRVESFKRRMTPGRIPETLVAVDGHRADGVQVNGVQVIGMASIVESDLSTHPDLSPWMASVYVDAAHRGRGVGSCVVRAIMDEAKTLGIERLYLITHDQMSFYRRLGWQTMESVHYRGEVVTIMFYDTESL